MCFRGSWFPCRASDVQLHVDDPGGALCARLPPQSSTPPCQLHPPFSPPPIPRPLRANPPLHVLKKHFIVRVCVPTYCMLCILHDCVPFLCLRVPLWWVLFCSEHPPHDFSVCVLHLALLACVHYGKVEVALVPSTPSPLRPWLPSQPAKLHAPPNRKCCALFENIHVCGGTRLPCTAGGCQHTRGHDGGYTKLEVLIGGRVEVRSSGCCTTAGIVWQ